MESFLFSGQVLLTIENGDCYRLDCTTMLFSQTLSFEVAVVDNDDFWLTDGSAVFELQRFG